MKINLGKIIDGIAIPDLNSAMLILDRDCSKDINIGEAIEIHLTDGKVMTSVLTDGLLDPGSKHGMEQENISVLRIEGGDHDGSLYKGGEVFKA